MTFKEVPSFVASNIHHHAISHPLTICNPYGEPVLPQFLLSLPVQNSPLSSAMLPLSSPSPSVSLLPIGTNVPHNFTFEELEAATDGFSEERLLGQGGYGKVYDAWLDVPVEEEGDEGRGVSLAEGTAGRFRELAIAGNSREGTLRGGVNTLMLASVAQNNGSNAPAPIAAAAAAANKAAAVTAVPALDNAAAAVDRLSRDGAGGVEEQREGQHEGQLEGSASSVGGKLGREDSERSMAANGWGANGRGGSELGMHVARSAVPVKMESRGTLGGAAASSREPTGLEAQQLGVAAGHRDSETEHRNGSQEYEAVPQEARAAEVAEDGHSSAASGDSAAHKDGHSSGDETGEQVPPVKREHAPVHESLAPVGSEAQGMEPHRPVASEPQGGEPQGQLARVKKYRKGERRRVAVKKLEALALQGFNEWLVRGRRGKNDAIEGVGEGGNA